jgi:hypothetical protein
MTALATLITGLSALGLVAPPETVQGNAVVVISVHFIDLGEYEPPCSDLELIYFPELVGALPLNDRPTLNVNRQRFKDSFKHVQQARQRAAVAARDVQILAAEDMRSRDDDDSSRVITALGSPDMLYGLYEWCAALWNLDSVETTHRNIVMDYYAGFSKAFPVLPLEKQQAVLSEFEQRMQCLQDERRNVFEQVEQQRRRSWDTILSDVANEVSGDVDLDASVRAWLTAVELQRGYAWLVPESTLHISTYRTLLAQHELSLRSRELHPAMLRARRGGPGAADVDAARLAVARARAGRALMYVYQQDMLNEGTFQTQASTLLSIGKAFEDAGHHTLITAKGLVTAEVFKGLEPQVQQLAIIGILHKLLGDVLSAAVVTPIKDTFVQMILKPAAGLIGEDVKTSVDKAYDTYANQRLNLDKRIALLNNIRSHMTTATGMDFVGFLRSGQKPSGGTSIISIAPGIVNSTLQDGQFIAATQGGLPWIFEALCSKESDRRAVLLRGAQHHIIANVKAAAARLAVMRGLAAPNPDRPVTANVVRKITEPWADAAYDPWTSRTINADLLLQAVPFAQALRTLWNAPTYLKNVIEYLKGNIPDQNEYLNERVALQGKLQFLLHALGSRDFDYERLMFEHWKRYVGHVDLMTHSPEYLEAYRRIREAAWEADKIDVFVRHGNAEGTALSARGRVLLAAVQKGQDLELTDLAARVAHLKLRQEALTANYVAAAAQTRELQRIENLRRTVHHAGGRVDLSKVAHAFDAEATRLELVAVYESLYHSAIKDTVLGLVTSGLSSGVLTGLNQRYGINLALQEEAKDVGEALAAALNPWSGKFTKTGVMNTFTGAFKDASINAVAQIAARHQTALNEQQIEDALDIVTTVAWDVTSNIRTAVAQADNESMLNYMEHRERQRQVEEVDAELAPLISQARNLQRQLAALDDSPDSDTTRRDLDAALVQLDSEPGLQQLLARKASLVEDLDGVSQRYRDLMDDADEVAGLIADELFKAHTRDRIRGLNARGPPENLEAYARQLLVAEMHQKLTSDQVTADDIGRIVDPADPLRLHNHLLKGALNVTLLRNALRTARRNDPDRLPDIETYALALDKLRHKTLESRLQQFLSNGLTPGEREWVAGVVQLTPGPDHPEYAGLEDDVKITVVLDDGATPDQAQEISRRLHKFFADAGHALAGPGERRHVGIAADVQTWNRYRAHGPQGARAPPEADDYPGNTRLPTDGSASRQLSSDQLNNIELNQGFRADHAANMHAFAQKQRSFIIMRNGNPDSVKWFNNPDYMPKPMSSKAKTAKVGPHLGLVVDPSHPVQSKAWDDAIAAAATKSERNSLVYHRKRADDAWRDHKDNMHRDGYRVSDEGLIYKLKLEDPPRTIKEVDGREIYAVVHKNGTAVVEAKGIHGDYDLHGVYRVDGGRVVSVGFGTGDKGPKDKAARAVREQFNESIDGREKDFIRHGGQDNWEYDAKTSDPPVTIFFPDGREPLELKTPEEMKRFYEAELDIRWEYTDGHKDGTLYRLSAEQRWLSNRHNRVGRALYQKATAETELGRHVAIDRAEGHSLGAAATMRMTFLTDPQLHREAFAQLSPDDRRQRVDRVLNHSSDFMQLVDAFVVSHPIGNTLYHRSPDNPSRGHSRRILDHVEGLRRQAAPNETPFTAADVDMLRTVVLLTEHRNVDVWRVVFGGSDDAAVDKAVAVVRWMQDTAPKLLSETSIAWHAAQRHTRTSGTMGERARARRSAMELADLLTASTAHHPFGPAVLLQPPTEAGSDGTIDRERQGKRLRANRGAAARHRMTLRHLRDRMRDLHRDYEPTEQMSPEKREVVAGKVRDVVAAARAPNLAAARREMQPWVTHYAQAAGLAVGEVDR